jgi:Secretion system C-terminal sorting domain
MKFKIIILFCFFFSKGFTQTDSVFEFFPLHTGDVHQFLYHYSYETCYPESLKSYSSYLEEQVLGDTLLPTGFTYKTIISNLPMEQPLYYLRIDTPKANVYRYESYPNPHDVLLDSLHAEVGDSYVSEGWINTECKEVDTSIVFGTPTIVKHFHANYIPGAEISLAYGLGRFELLNYRDNSCYPVLDYLYTDLVYAKINGKEYGTYTSVVERSKSFPFKYELGQNYPNPFNPTTKIKYSIPSTRSPLQGSAKGGFVTLIVYDLLGREVAILVNEEQKTGNYEVDFNGANLSSGVYFYQLRAGNFISTKKMILLR